MTVEVLGTPPVLYGRLDASKAALIFREHAVNGKPLPQLALSSGREELR